MLSEGKTFLKLFFFFGQKPKRCPSQNFKNWLNLNNLPNFARRHQYKWLMDRKPALNLGALQSILCLPKATLDKLDNARQQVLGLM